MNLREPNQSERLDGLCVAAALLCLLLVGVGCGDGYAPSSEGSLDGEAGDTSDVATDAGNPDSELADTAGDEDSAKDTSIDGAGSDDADGGGEQQMTIERDEVPLEPETRALFEVAQDVEVNTTGSEKDGSRHWDYSGEYSSDSTEVIKLQSMDGQWFEAEFPEADYAMKLAGDSEELGVFRTTDEALLLLGIVSPEDGTRTTEIEYDPPVAILDFPLKKGKTWKTETTASGTHKTWSPWTPFTYDETYTNKVDAEGTLVTPYGNFDVLRVRTVMNREGSTTGAPLDTIRTFSFVAESFGTVATIRSKSRESEREFSDAAEIRRITR